MTNDLVQWLRENTEMWDHDYDMQTAAADRIEALDKRNKELEAALREIVGAGDTGNPYDAYYIARKALEGKK